MKKGQAAIEYMVVVAVGLLVLIPIVYYSSRSFQNYKEDTNILSAKTTVEKIGENVDWVYSQGYPARVQIKVYVPEKVTLASLENRTVLMRIYSTSGPKDVYYETISDMVGALPSRAGFYRLSVAATDGFVNVSVQ